MSRTRYSAGWMFFIAVAALGCTDRPTEVRRLPVAQFDAGTSDEGKSSDVTASTRWNRRATALLALRPPANSQAWTSRMLTYLSIAQYRAVLAAERGKGRGTHPSVNAAVSRASAAVLDSFFPLDVASIEQYVTDDLTRPAWTDEENETDNDSRAGEAIGRAVGEAVLALVATDNYFVTNPGVPPVGPGYWVSSSAAIVRSMHGTRPFFLTSASQLRPAPPPAFAGTDGKFNAALEEIRAITDNRTDEQTAIGRNFAWATAPFTAGNLNLIADSLITAHHRTEQQAARILAYANAAAFDAQIACFDAKFFYWFIRPTQADPGIKLIGLPTPVALPNHPSYPSGHSCITGAILTVLGDAFPSERRSLNALITEIGLSRMYAGLHYRFDVEAGQAIGRGAAALALDGSLEGDRDSRTAERDR